MELQNVTWSDYKILHYDDQRQGSNVTVLVL